MTESHSPEYQPRSEQDPLLGPLEAFDPLDYGFIPELVTEHALAIDESRGDLKLFLLQETQRKVKQLKDARAGYPDTDEQLVALQERIDFRKKVLEEKS